MRSPRLIRQARGVKSPPEDAPVVDPTSGKLIRTAMCIEPRNGILHVFLPPVSLLEEFVELVAAIEDVATELQQPLRLEGSQDSNARSQTQDSELVESDSSWSTSLRHR